MNYWLILLPFLSALIGWLANSVAIKLLFHPVKPRNIMGVTFRGVLPERKNQIAKKLGKLFAAEFFSSSEISSRITDPGNLDKLVPYIDEHIEHFLKVRLKESMPMISMFVGDKTILQMKNLFIEELKTLFPVIMEKYVGNLQEQLDLEQIVTQKIVALPDSRIEQFVLQSMSQELRYVKVFGAALGFVIGLIQVMISYLVNQA